MALTDHIRHVSYENDIPSEIEDSLIRLYRSVFCVTDYFRLYRSYDNINALAIYADTAEPVHAIFYSIAGREAVVLNELFEIEHPYLQYFADFIFGKYPGVHTINLNRIRNRIRESTYPFRIWNRSCDIVVPLPESIEAYRSKLGKHTKGNLNNYSNKLRKEHSDYAFTVTAADRIDPADVRRIIDMNRSRMESKDIRSAFDAGLENRIVAFAGKYGLVATIRINGRIAAGTVCYEVGDHCYADIIAHDPAYNKYSIGQVCIYLTIKTLIERGRHAFHMLWGENDYKFRFLGEKEEHYFVSIYRSRWHRLLGAVRHPAKFRYVIMARDLAREYRRRLGRRLSGPAGSR